MQEPTQTPGAAGAPTPGMTEAGPPTWSADPGAAEVPEPTAAGPAAGDAPRRHNDPRRCAACGYRDICDEVL